MYSLSYSSQFSKDLKLAQRRGYKIDLLKNIIDQLHQTGKLETQFRPHKLQGKYSDYMECHIKSGWLLIWLQNDKTMEIKFIRTGTHEELF